MWWRRERFVVFLLVIRWFQLCLCDSERLLISSDTTLASPGDVFELGFFNPGSSYWYIGIWYKYIPKRTYVWVANRDQPLINSNGTLRISDFNILLRDHLGNLVWTTDVTRTSYERSPLVAELMDNGNFVMRFSNSNKKKKKEFLWQSFDSPTDTLLPGMTLRSVKGVSYPSNGGWNSYLISWINNDNPKSGYFSYGLETQRFTRLSIWNKSSGERIYRSGAWDGLKFIDVPMQFILTTTTGENKMSYMYQATRNNTYERVILTSMKEVQMLIWDQAQRKWITLWSEPGNSCDLYNFCRENSYCELKWSPEGQEVPECNCITGFSKRHGWCERNQPLGCSSQDKFSLLTNMKLPDTIDVVQYSINQFQDCQEMCLRDCHCTAFTLIVNQNSSTSFNCVVWRNNLFDVRKYQDNEGRDLHIRITGDVNNNLGGKKSKNKTGVIIGVVVGVTAVLLLLFLAIFCIWRRRKQRNATPTAPASIIEMEPIHGREIIESLNLPMMDFGSILIATENFSDSRELGRGGFGKVYKGRLHDGQEIAVKKLLNTSSQGLQEFQNEVTLIASLQHINLVRLIGWSLVC